MHPKSLYLVDDHPVVGLGFRLTLRGSRDFLFVGTSTDPNDGLAKIAEIRPRVVVLDLVFDGMVRTDLVAATRRIMPSAMIACFTSLPERQWSKSAREAGSDVYVEKSVELDMLFARIAAQPAPAMVPPAQTPGELSALPIEGVDLTPREVSVAARLAAGVSVSDIAQEMAISVNTVAVHQENIRRKIGCPTAKQLVARLAALQFPGNGRV